MSSGDRYDGYSVNLFLDEDRDWLAHLVELPFDSRARPRRAGVSRRRGYPSR